MKPPKLICFDLNKTLIRENSWRDLNLAMGVTAAEDDMLGAWGEQGIITDQQGQDILCALYKARGADISRQKITGIVCNYTWMPGARETIRQLQAVAEIVLISGAMDVLVGQAAAELGIETWRASNRFVFNDKDELDVIIAPEKDADDKLAQLTDICRERGIRLNDCLAIGDGANDIRLFKATGRGITFTDSAIKEAAWKTVGQLSDIVTLLSV